MFSAPSFAAFVQGAFPTHRACQGTFFDLGVRSILSIGYHFLDDCFKQESKGYPVNDFIDYVKRELAK